MDTNVNNLDHKRTKKFFVRKTVNTSSRLQPGLYIQPLGGTGEIGKNFTIFSLIDENGHAQRIIVDVGASIGKSYGIRLIIPTLDIIYEQYHDILGIIITHAHEDHIGGIAPMILHMKRKFRIFATKFTMLLIVEKLKENNIMDYVELIEIPMGHKWTIGDFYISLLYVTHSTLEPNMIVIKTQYGNLLHTGDWKFDLAPTVGEPTNFEVIKQLGDEGIDVLLCDSTNSTESSTTESESVVEETLNKILRENKHKGVIFTSFASNVHRMLAAINAAKKYDRHVVIMGSSPKKVYNAAVTAGYLPEESCITDLHRMINIDPTKLLIFCSGSQGEEGAILWKMAYGINKYVKLSDKYIVCFSARQIIGNEKEINSLQNMIIRTGATILDSKTHSKIHVSGHPNEPDIKLLIELLRPKSVLTVHGDDIKMLKLKEICEKLGVKHVLVPCNGLLISVEHYHDDTGNHTNLIPIRKDYVGAVGVDGNQLVNLDSKLLKIRDILSKEGIIFITIINNIHYQISHSGLIEPDVSIKTDFINYAKKIVHKSILGLKNKEDIKNSIVANISDWVLSKYNKNPFITVHIYYSKQNTINKDFSEQTTLLEE